MPAKISIVVPTLNGGALLRECLEAIRAQKTASEVELLAVDSGSRDETLATLKEFGANVRGIPQSQFNHGATRNMAIEMAAGELIVLTVQDAVPQGENWLNALTAPFADARVAGVYGRQIPRPDADLLTKKRLEDWLTSRKERSVSEIANRAAYEKMSPMEKYTLCNFDNVCSCIRKSVWREHRFPETNFAEDIEWARDVILAGHRIVYEPSAAVVHSHRRTLLYEYRRTYIAARRLRQVFGYAAVRSLYEFCHHSWYYAAKNAKTAWRANAPTGVRARAAIRAMSLGVLETLAQYRAFRDEKGNRPLDKQRGV